MKNTGAPIGDFNGWICPFTKFSLRNSSSSFCSVGERGNVLPLGSLALGWSSMAWFHALQGGRWANVTNHNACVTCHTSVTDFRPKSGNPMEVTLVTSPKLYIVSHAKGTYSP